MQYRKEVDGLRAIAILPVILFHAGSKIFSGGFVGVDIFFVISGYLITNIILAEKVEGKFSLLRFYERRARRIIPTLFCVLFVTLPFAWFWMLPDQLKEFSESLIAVSAFSSNILFWKQSGYFDASSELKPLLHTWSLAVEEQYYVLFPLLLSIFLKLSNSLTALRAFFVLLFISSFYFSQAILVTHASEAFYLLPSRAWELLLGALIPLVFSDSCKKNITLVKAEFLAAFGLTCILTSIFFYDGKTPFPGFYALLPTMGAFLILMYADARTYVGKLLSHKLISGIGLISYSAYLWHQPILAFYKIKTSQIELSNSIQVLYFVIVILLSIFSYIYIETPFRSKERVSRSKLFILVISGSVLFVVLGILGFVNNGFYSFKTSKIAVEKKPLVIKVDEERRARLEAFSKQQNYLMQGAFQLSNGKQKVVVFGDSMGADLSLSFAENSQLFPQFDFRYLSVTNECLDSLYSSMNSSCSDNLRNVLSSKVLSQSNFVIVTFLWKDDADFGAIEKMLLNIKKINKNILILGSGSFLDVSSIAFKIAADSSSYTQDDIDKIVAQSRRGKFDAGNAKMVKIAKKLDIPYRDRHDLYCDSQQKKCRILNVDGGTILWDNAHLTTKGRSITAMKIAELGWLQ
ncbi:acyltransferase family protein [Undibacterium sp. SXout11W]|uniref:acyltransferase family protein n=1 Tax=Undibacterium sp. SXout11W TaxID=3413050 RepID=UPI003BF0B842